MSSDAPKDFGGFLSSAQSCLPVPLGAISSSKSYSCSCSLLHRERKPLKLLQLCCTVCWNSSHQKGEEEKCLYLFKLIIEAPAEMWRQTERGDLICGVLLRKSIANLCIDFLLLAQNEAAVPKILFTGNVLRWDRQTSCDQLNSCSAAREHHREVKSSAALIMERFKPVNNMKKSLQKLHQNITSLFSGWAVSEVPWSAWRTCLALQWPIN